MSLMSSSQLLDGVIMSQTQPPATATDYIDTSGGRWVCQEFMFPANYIRGTVGNQAIPNLTGVHVFANIATDRADAVGVQYRVQRYLFGSGWITEGEGNSILAEADDDVWLKVNFEKPIEVNENMLDDRWRFCIQTLTGTTYRLPVEYDGAIAYLPSFELPIALLTGESRSIIWPRPDSYSDLVLTDDPALFLRVNEDLGTTALDSSGNGHPGTYTGSFSLAQPGLLTDDSDRCVDLTGGWIETTYTFGSVNQLTFEGLAIRDTSTTEDILLGTQSSPFGGRIRLRAGNNNFQLEPNFAVGSVTWTNAWPGNGVVVHWAVTHDQVTGIAELFINGVSQGVKTSVPDWTPTALAFIGSSGGNDPFDGRVDEIAVYDHILTPEHITSHYERSTGSLLQAPAILHRDSDGPVYFSEQQGVDAIWLSRPNPLQTSGFVRATNLDESPIQIAGEDTSLLFRLIGDVGDDGVDFLGNQYRHAVIANTAEAVESSFGGDSDTFWYSKPNPSRFAVETLYFDMRNDAGKAQVVDRIYIDPVTPNVYFNVYYSDEGEAGTTSEEWEEKVWTHVPKQYKMVKQENHVLPKPISTKYIAIEFSQLQPRPYAPGYFQQPIRYKKHPRWVLDYFLARTELDQLTSLGNQFVPRQVGITYNAIDLAYNYRLDDLAQEPDAPVIITPNARNQALADVSGNKAGVVDTQALDQLRLVFNQFQRHPAFFSNVRYLLSDAVTAIVDNYPSELPDLLKQQYDVSALTQINKDSLIYEAGMPVMFFFIPCRHRYKEVSAELSHERAYFVGVRQIAFSREKYTVANDTGRYVETMGDAVNMERTDFVRVEGGGYAVY